MFILSSSYNDKHKKLRKTGRLPEINAAERNSRLFLALGIVLLAVAIFLIFKWDSYKS